jgi:tetratricopeptide (TPR) repeat protein
MDEAIRYAEQALRWDPLSPNAHAALSTRYYYAGRLDEAEAMRRKVLALYRGEIDCAFDWLERSAETHDSGLTNARVDPLLRNLHADPRWGAFLSRNGLAD